MSFRFNDDTRRVIIKYLRAITKTFVLRYAYKVKLFQKLYLNDFRSKINLRYINSVSDI